MPAEKPIVKATCRINILEDRVSFIFEDNLLRTTGERCTLLLKILEELEKKILARDMEKYGPSKDWAEMLQITVLL